MCKDKPSTNSIKELLLRKTVSHKLIINRIKYRAHVLRRPSNHVLRNALVYAAPGKNKVGRPCHTCNDSLRHDLQCTGKKNWNRLVQDRVRLNRQCSQVYDVDLSDDETTDSDDEYVP